MSWPKRKFVSELSHTFHSLKFLCRRKNNFVVWETFWELVWQVTVDRNKIFVNLLRHLTKSLCKNWKRKIIFLCRQRRRRGACCKDNMKQWSGERKHWKHYESCLILAHTRNTYCRASKIFTRQVALCEQLS